MELHIQKQIQHFPSSSFYSNPKYPVLSLTLLQDVVLGGQETWNKICDNRYFPMFMNSDNNFPDVKTHSLWHSSTTHIYFYYHLNLSITTILHHDVTLMVCPLLGPFLTSDRHQIHSHMQLGRMLTWQRFWYNHRTLCAMTLLQKIKGVLEGIPILILPLHTQDITYYVSPPIVAGFTKMWPTLTFGNLDCIF